MARKGLLANVTSVDFQRAENEIRSDYTRRGASRSMMVSIDEMAENSKRMAAGELIVDLDPSLIDGSFVSDRLDDKDFDSLREAIKTRGQTTPILVRPSQNGRYMIVFGHRRTRVARELGIKVRAVVKNLEDISHIIIQGQENSARADLTFIEKALFARKLLNMDQSKQTIKEALTVDDTLLSRMLSVADVVPGPVVEAIGSAKGVGRDRWEQLKKLLLRPNNCQRALEIVRTEEFESLEDRFGGLVKQLNRTKPQKRQPSSWAADDSRVTAIFAKTGKTFSLSFKLKDAGEFGDYVSSHLDSLYEAFKAAKTPNPTKD